MDVRCRLPQRTSFCHIPPPPPPQSGGKVAPVSVTQVAEYANERPIHPPITTTATEFCIDGLDDEAAADADADVDMGDKGGSSSATSAAKKLLVVPTVPWLVRLSLVVPGARVAEAAAAVRQTFALLSEYVLRCVSRCVSLCELLRSHLRQFCGGGGCCHSERGGGVGNRASIQACAWIWCRRWCWSSRASRRGPQASKRKNGAGAATVARTLEPNI